MSKGEDEEEELKRSKGWTPSSRFFRYLSIASLSVGEVWRRQNRNCLLVIDCLNRRLGLIIKFLWNLAYKSGSVSNKSVPT